MNIKTPKKRPDTVSMKNGATSTSTQENTTVHIAGEQDGKIWTFGLGGIILSVIYLILYDSPCSCPCSSDHNPRRANFHWTHVRPAKLNCQKKNLLKEETNWTTWWRHRWSRRCRGSSALDGDLRPREPPLARCPHWNTASGFGIKYFEKQVFESIWYLVFGKPVWTDSSTEVLESSLLGTSSSTWK